MECVFVDGIDVRFGSGHSHFHFIVLPSLYDTEIRADFVITLCAPRNVVHVGKLSRRIQVSRTHRAQGIKSPAHRIYVQDVDVSGRHQKVLDEGSNHVPRFEL